MGFFNFIFAGMLLLLFASMTIGAARLPAHQSLSVGYATVDSPERAQKISTKLLSDKLAENVVIIPGVTSLRASEDLKTPQSISTDQAQLLLIETRDELIGSVRAGIETVYEGINVPQVLFSHVRGPQGAPIRKYEELGKEIVIDSEEEKPKDKSTGIPTEKTVYLNRESEFRVPTKLGESILLLVQGNPTTGYEWNVDQSATSKSLTVGPFIPVPDNKKQPILIGAPTLFSLKVVPTEAGNPTLTLRYTRAWNPSDNPSVKVINFIVS